MAGDITNLLVAYGEGDRAAFQELVPIVYDDLREIAHRLLRRHGGRATLDTSALVHEAYLKFVDQTQGNARDRSHFFALAARIMRHTIIDHVRHRRAQKRGGGKVPVPLDAVEIAVEDHAEELIAIDRALGRLSELSERLTRVFECRFFAGLTEQETADALGMSLRTVQRDFKKSKAWLRTELRSC